MSKIKRFLNNFKHIFVLLFAVAITFTCIYNIKGYAASYSLNGYTFNKEVTDTLPVATGNYYLTKDVRLTSNWTISCPGSLRLYLNDHKIDLNGYQIVIDYKNTTLSIHDDHKTRRGYSLGDNGLADLTGNDYYFYGGYITNGRSAAININSGTFQLYGGAIVRNGTDSSNLYGGGICSSSTTDTNKIYMYGGTICGNRASYGAGIYQRGSLALLYASGGTIENNVATQRGGGIYNKGKIYVQDAESLANATDKRMTNVYNNYLNNKENNVHLDDSTNIEFTGGVSGGRMGISYTTARYYFTKNYSTYVSGSISPSDLFYDDEHKRTATKVTESTTSPEIDLRTTSYHEHDGQFFSSFTATTQMPSATTAGNYSYYLTNDMKLNYDWEIGSNVNFYLCLNGHSINLNGHKFKIGGKLYIYDCTNVLTNYRIDDDGKVVVKTGNATGTFDRSFRGGYIYGGSNTAFDVSSSYGSSSTSNRGLYLYNGALINNDGGAVSVNGSYSYFYMYGGAIVGNQNTTNSRSSAVYSSNGGKIYLLGGYISNNINKASTSYGAVYSTALNYNCIFVGHDCKVFDNTYNNEYKQDIYLEQNQKIAFQSVLYTGAKLGIYYGYTIPNSTTSYAITSGFNYESSSSLPNPNIYFQSNRQEYTFALNTSYEVEVKQGHEHNGIQYTAINTTYIPSGTTAGYYYLNKDLTFNGNWTVPVGNTILCLNGHKISVGSYKIIVGEGRSLTIFDCSDKTFYYTVNSETGKATISTSGTKFKNGYIMGGGTSYDDMFDVSGTLRLEGINIFNYNSTMGFSAIGVKEGGTFEMEGGQISCCKSSKGGALNATNGTVLLNNVEFNYNQATNQGGAIYLEGSNAYFDASDITLNNNKTTSTGNYYGGGALYINDATANINNMVANNNTSVKDGGAIYVYSGTLNLYNAELKNNSATNGGAIYNKVTSDNKVIINGATISENIANYGGGIYNYSNSYITLKNGVYVEYNSATTSGGAIYNAGNLTLDGSTNIISITNNTLTNGTDGAGIYNNKYFNIKGLIEITSNKDKNNANSNLYLNLSGSTYNYIDIKGDLDINSMIYITSNKEEAFITSNFNKVTNQDFTNYFALDKTSATYSLSLQGSANNVYYGNPNAHVHDGITFKLWDSATSLPTSGNYYLTKDVELSANVSIASNSTVNLCLNGHKIDFDSYRYISLYGTINLYDCDETIHNYTLPTNARVTTIGSGSESFTGGYLTNSTQRAIYIYGNGTFNMYGGTLIGFAACYGTQDISYEGGAILINGDNATFNMYGGNIIGNYAQNNSGAICINLGTANIYGGTIKNNIAGNTGGAIYLANGTSTTAKLNIGNIAYIYGNKANGVSDDVRFDGSKGLSVVSKLNTGAKIGISVDSTVTKQVVTSGYKTYNSSNAANVFFTLHNTGYELLKDSNGEILVRIPHTHSLTYSIVNNGTTLRTTCNAANCTETSIQDIVLSADGGSYDGYSHGATISGLTTMISQTGVNLTYSLTYRLSNGTTTTTAPKNAGTYRALLNITIDGTTRQLYKDYTITRKTITVTSGITAENKVYDGTNIATLDFTNAIVSGVLSGDSITVTAKGTFATSFVGNDIFVSITNYAVSGTSGNNYQITSSGNQNQTTASITAKAIQVAGGIIALDKVYDGTTDATFDTTNAILNGLIDGDDVTVIVEGSFANKEVQANKTVKLLNIYFDGEYGCNYKLGEGNQSSTTASIVAREVVVSGIGAKDKAYDGTKNASVVYTNMVIDNVLEGESVSAIAYVEFADKNAGEGKTVNITNIILSGVDKNNYTVSDESQKTTTATIRKTLFRIVSGVTAYDKVYDGTLEATIDLTNMEIMYLLEGDEVNVSATGEFEKAVPGENLVVTITYSLSGADALNYFVGKSQITTLANITKKSVTVSGITAEDKIYDKKSGAVLDFSNVTIEGIIGTAMLNVTANGSFEDANAGEHKVVNINNLELTGKGLSLYYLAETGNQTITYANIAKKEVAFTTIYTNNKDYDGTTNGTIVHDTFGVSGAYKGDILLINATATFIDANAGVNKTVYITDLEIDPTSPSYNNYYLAETGNTLYSYATINKIDRTYTSNSYEGIYDKLNHTITVNIDGDEVVSYSNTEDGTYSTDLISYKNVGTYTVYYLVESTNYNDYYGSDEVIITRKVVKVSGITAENKVYDGNTNATLDYENALFEGLIDGDELTVTATGEFADSNYGTNKTVNISNILLSGSSVSNYVLAESGNQTTATADITKDQMNLTINGYEDTYDKEAHSITISGAPVGSTIKYSTEENGEYSTDVISYINAGTYTIYYLVECDNYESVTGSETVIINKKEITIENIIANDKVYDATTDVTLDLTHVQFNGLISPDTLTIEATGAFVDANAGENKTVNITNLVLGGNHAANYVLAEDGQQTETTATISKKGLIASNIKANGKNYDGNTNALMNPTYIQIEGIIDGAEVHVAVTGEYEDPNAGSNKIIYITYGDMWGTGYQNYCIDVEHSQKTIEDGYIAQGSMSSLVSIKGYTGIYDGEYHGLTINAMPEGATITYSTYTSNPYSSEPITYKFAGEDRIYYKIEHPNYFTVSSYVTINIQKKEATVISGIVGIDKEYNNRNTATLDGTNALIDGLIEGDVVTVTATGTFVSTNVGEDIEITITEIRFGGTNGSCYTLSASGNQATTTANITKREVTVNSILGVDKVYDGNTDAELDLSGAKFAGRCTGDILTITATGTFADANVGSQTINITNLVLGGESVGNYYLATTGNQETTTANITKATMSISSEGYEGIYDKNAHGITISNTPSGSTIKYSQTEDGEYSTTELLFTNAGTYSVYFIVENSNYESYAGMEQIIINKKEITVSNIIVNDKEYDGNTNASLDYSEVVFGGIISNDEISVSATAVFSDKNVGTNKVVTISDLVVGGNDNYVLAQTGNQTSGNANITKKEIKVSGIKALDKPYDGNDVATLDYQEVEFMGLISGDSLNVTATGTFASVNVGENITVTISNLVISGTDEGNYELASTGNQTVAQANITNIQMELTINGYEGTYDKEAHSITISGAPEGSTIKYSLTEDGEYSVTEQLFTNAGTYTVYYTVECENYETVSGSKQVIINKKEITVDGIKANDKIYDGTRDATLDYSEVVFDGILENDSLEIEATGMFNNYNVFDNIAVSIYDYVLGGADVNNYYLAMVGNQYVTYANISKKVITVSNIKANDKAYDGTTSVTFDYSDVVFNGIISGDTLEVTATGAFENKDAAKNIKVNITNIELGGTSEFNYELNVASSQNEAYAKISKKKIVVASGITANPKTYDGNSSATLNTTNAVIEGLVEGETLVINAYGSFTDYNAGTNKEVLIEGMNFQSTNYEFSNNGQQRYAYTEIYKAEMSGFKVNGYEGIYDKEAHGITISDVPEGSTVKYGLDPYGYGLDEQLFTNAGTYTIYFSIENSNYNTFYAFEFVTIHEKELSFSGIKANDKVFDGTDAATVDYSEIVYEGIIDGDNVEVRTEAKFMDIDVNNDITVQFFNMNLVGSEASNYKISSSAQTSTTASIIYGTITYAVTCYEGTYDKEAHTITFSDIDSKVVISYATEENGMYNLDPISYTNVGTYKIYYKLDRIGYTTVMNYATVIINPKEVTVSNISASDKVYDGTMDATINIEDALIEGVIDGDELTIIATGSFADKNAGNDKVVTLDVTLSNSNYKLSSDSQSETTANITKKTVKVSGITANNKNYDGTTSATVVTTNAIVDGVIEGETITITATGSFADSEAGSDKKVIISNIELVGEDSSNYEIDIVESQSETKANIIKEETVDPEDPKDPENPTDPENPEDDKPKEKKNNTGAIIGIIAGIIALAAAAGVVAVLVIKKKP